MKPLYSTAIALYGAAIRVAAARNDKARQWVRGRKNWRASLKAFRAKHPGPLLWVHAASTGEFEQARPVVEALRKAHPSLKMYLTFFSPSGFQAFAHFEHVDGVGYLPLDTPQNARDFIALLQPTTAFIVKYEFWLNLLAELHKKAIPTLVAPAIFRPDQFFFKPWGKAFLAPLKKLNALLVQNDESMALLQGEGFENASLCGDSRFDRVAAIAHQNEAFERIEAFVAGRTCIVCGSTWPADDEVILPALQNLGSTAIILALHELREEALAALEAKLTKPHIRWCSWDGQPTHAEILLLDTMGMLSRIYRYGHVSYVGGGFTTGIHSILEPAAFGMPLIFGPDFDSFREARDLIHRGAAHSVKNGHEFQAALAASLAPGAYEKARRICRAYVSENEGAALKIQAAVEQLLTL